MAWNHKDAEVLAALVFTIATVLHLVRNLSGWAMKLGPYNIPAWASWIAVIVAGYLAFHFWKKIGEE